jgi:iron complex transport system substrate-binding protein
LWQQLNAVKQGKVYQVPDYWIGYGPLAANAVIDDLYKYILDK